MNASIPKPYELSTEARFYNVNGTPVAVDDVEAFRYDGAPAMFDLTSVMSEGIEISLEEFVRLLPIS